MLDARIVERLCCPVCRGEIAENENGLDCTVCARTFKIDGTVPVLLDDSERKTDASFDYVRHYERDSEAFDYFEERFGATKHSERRIREYVLSLVPKQAKNVLDVGCGSAWVAKALQRSGIFFVSLDISAVNPLEALKRYPSPDHVGVAADSYRLPFKDGSFDCIVASEIIEHLHDPSAFGVELLRVTKPGGSMIISTPYDERLVYELCIHCQHLTPHNAHLHSWDEPKLRRLFPSETKWEFFTMNNKVLVFARTYPLLQWMPFRLWRFVDRVANFVFPRPVNSVFIVGK